MSAGVYYHRQCGAPLFWRAEPYQFGEVVMIPPAEDRLALFATFTGSCYCRQCFAVDGSGRVYLGKGSLTWVEDLT